jgi:tRNA dimethylallyltransferase
MIRAVLIAGPTASGKSALALALAERMGGVVINTDSMQVYRDLRVITARPTPEEESRAPHLLYGHVDAAENYSTGRWVADAERALAGTRANGRLPIFVGGTGLYFKALTKGLSAMPPVPPEIRAQVRGEAEAASTPDLHAKLVSIDPRTAAGLRTSDRQRVLRALEIFAATGRPLAEWQERPGAPIVESDQAAAVFLSIERKELWRRIDARFDAMMSGGALDEVRALAARKLDPTLPAMKAHGVPWLMRHLADEISLEEAVLGAKVDTRHYSKRQETWFRHQMKDWTWAAPEQALESLLAAVR